MKPIQISCLVLASLLVGLVTGCSRSTVARLDAGGGYRVIVTADNSWEYSRPYYYEIRRGKTVVVPRTYIDLGKDPGASLQLAFSGDRQVIGLVETNSPEVVLALFDVATGETWPRRGSDEQDTVTNERGLALLKKLQSSNSKGTFTLSDDVPGNSTARPKL